MSKLIDRFAGSLCLRSKYLEGDDFVTVPEFVFITTSESLIVTPRVENDAFRFDFVTVPVQTGLLSETFVSPISPTFAHGDERGVTPSTTKVALSCWLISGEVRLPGEDSAAMRPAVSNALSHAGIVTVRSIIHKFPGAGT